MIPYREQRPWYAHLSLSTTADTYLGYLSKIAASVRVYRYSHRLTLTRLLDTSGSYLDYYSDKHSLLRWMVRFPSASSNPGNVSIYFWFVTICLPYTQIN